MVRIENPVAILICLVALILSVGLLPFLKTKQFRLTPSKITALMIVCGYSVYQGSLLPLLIFIWPLSFIWYPEYWGSFVGHLNNSPYIDEKSPPFLVAAFGWFFLIVYPLAIIWMSSR